MNNRNSVVRSALAVVLLSLAQQARADLVVGNLNLGDPGQSANAGNVGQLFNTGSLSTQLDSIYVGLSGNATSVSGLTAGLYTDTNSSDPTGGTLLATLDQASPITSMASIVEFLPMGTIALAANTNYWFVFDSSNAAFDTYFEFTGSFTTYGPGSLLGLERASGIAPFNMIIQVNSAVPEPSSVVMLGLGSLGLIGVVRRSRAGR